MSESDKDMAVDVPVVFRWVKLWDEWTVAQFDRYGIFLPGQEPSFDMSDFAEVGDVITRKDAE
jgi:hypothetical protein